MVNHAANVGWQANTWYTLQDVAAVVQEVIYRPGWNSGNSLALILAGTSPGAFGRKFARSFEGNPAQAARLVITYESCGSGAGVVALAPVCQVASPTPTVVPGICRIQVAATSLNAYTTARDGAIDFAPAFPTRVFANGTVLEVYARSELSFGLVRVQTSSTPGQNYWINSGEGYVALVSGNCNLLPYEAPTPAVVIPNPPVRPTYTNYPLQVTNPSQVYNTTGVPYYDLYQFAYPNIPFYTSTNGRHPGTDFFQGPVASTGQSVGISVAAVADGLIIGYYDPCIAGQPANTPMTTVKFDNTAGWIDGASPTDRPPTGPQRAYIVIQYGNTIVLYDHLQPCFLRWPGPQNTLPITGSAIIAGQRLGKIAAQTNGAHLHLETRTYGLGSLNLLTTPLIFVDGWVYFNATLRTVIDTNMNNRRLEGAGGVIAGWNGTWSPGTYDVQCFTAANLTGYPSGNSIYGYAPAGSTNPLPGTPFSVYEYINSGNFTRVNSTTISSWQAFCVP